MSFFDKMTAFLPLGKKEQALEYFFAINIGIEHLTAALWTIEGKELKILSTASESYSSNDELTEVSDKLLDQVLGLREVEPQKILFGVPSSWLSDDNLKDEYLKILRGLVKELELTPMAYVAEAHALVHFLEKQEGIPITAILVDFQKLHLIVTVVRAGRLDGVKVVKRGENSGADIEKALLTFTDVETLPSKILIYGPSAGGLKSQLSSFSWMSKLAFLHLPKIEALEEDLEIKSVCLAGGSEINEGVVYLNHLVKKQERETIILDSKESSQEILGDLELEHSDKSNLYSSKAEAIPVDDPESFENEDNFGFVVGDVAKESRVISEVGDSETGLAASGEHSLEVDDFEKDLTQADIPSEAKHKQGFNFKKFIPKKLTTLVIPLGILSVVVMLIGAYIFLLKADVKIYVEPKILEKDAQVVADPDQKNIDEASKIIPGQIVDIEISGTARDTASGRRQIGDPAKGTIIIYNKTFSPQSLSKGIQISGQGGTKFTLDTSVTIASQSASDSGIAFGKANTTVTATSIGADGNLPSGSDFTIAGYVTSNLAAKSEGNFAGGTSKDVTVVSSEDQQRLLAKLSSDLRQQAQQQLQEKYPNKKILEEALSEGMIKKSYSKNINDQASEFSLNMSVQYKGTAFDDADLRTIVSKLVNLQVPEGFQLDLAETETQADVSKLEKDGKLIFLARFKAKLLPRIDTDNIKNQIKLKTPDQVDAMLKDMDNILGSDITLIPNLPKPLSRLPLLTKNIRVEVGVK